MRLGQPSAPNAGSITPSLRAAGFEDDDEDSLSDVASALVGWQFCQRAKSEERLPCYHGKLIGPQAGRLSLGRERSWDSFCV